MLSSRMVLLSLVSLGGMFLCAQGFLVGTGSMTMPVRNVRPNAVSTKVSASSVDIESSGEAEQTTIESKTMNGMHEDSEGGRYDELVANLGLEGKLKQVGSLPPNRKVSPYGVFCNRELKQKKLAAVGFDMDYTLCQYKQPAFDKLAFDGAKEKLVYKLGYPKEVLDFEYDHEVKNFSWKPGIP